MIEESVSILPLNITCYGKTFIALLCMVLISSLMGSLGLLVSILQNYSEK